MKASMHYGTWSKWLAGLLALWCAAAIGAAPAPDKSTANYEVDFLEGMIDHHAMAVQMATLCEARAVHEELRALCTQIRESQSPEIATMQGWLASWYSDPYQPEMSSGDMKRMDKLASLAASEFEIAFMEMMIKHHAKAVKEASTCLERAYHPELLSLCQNIIDTQTREIVQMRTWLCQWYGICNAKQ
jgi:uncharacterized protein (DUF305 family)